MLKSLYQDQDQLFRSCSGSKLFAKFISGPQKSLLARKELTAEESVQEQCEMSHQNQDQKAKQRQEVN